MEKRGHRKTTIGIVTSDKMDKTIAVTVERLVKHPQYKKYIRKYTKLKAHDENKIAHIGDRVELMETRPLSKTKNWRLIRVVKNDAGTSEAPKAPETTNPTQAANA